MCAKRTKFLPGSAGLPLAALLLAGCATVQPAPVIKSGDEVGIHFTCRFPNGQVASTTRKEVIYDPTLPKAPILLPVSDDDPVPVTAGKPTEFSPLRTPGFEDEIVRQLTLLAVGMREGERKNATLSAETVAVRGSEPQKLDMARVRHREKVMRVSRDQFKKERGKDPEVGAPYTLEPSFPGKVTAVTDQDVTITITGTPGSTIWTPFGTGTVKETADTYDIDLDVKQGTLARSSGLVGRISAVGADTFTIDYSNAFAGESLNCDYSAVALPKGAAGSGGAITPAAEPAVTIPPVPAASLEGTLAETERLKAVLTDALKDAKGSATIDLSPLQAAKGDLVQVRFSVSNPDGSALELPSGSQPQGTVQELMAGKDELFPGLGGAALGMASGERKTITLAPEQAFGPRDESKVTRYPRVNTVPARMTLPAEEYVKRFGGFPTEGKDVTLFPYLKARVAAVGEKEVTLSVSATDGAKYDESYGTITTTVDALGVSLTLTPKVGASVPAGDHPGLITGFDAESFTVDANHPLAGKTIVVNLELVSLTKVASLQGKPIEWIEGHDAGLALAQKEGKPVFMILYADWCGWCKKTLTESIPDPRVTGLKDKFVWVKVNSDKETKYKQQYGQNGYPLMLVLNPDGTLRKRIDGYRDAHGLKEELEGVL